MASSLPIPAPPRTPTPPTPIQDEDQTGLGINGGPYQVNSTVAYDPNSLSPMSDTFSGRFGSMSSALPSPAGAQSSASTTTSTFGNDGAMAPPPLPAPKGPFNFEPQTYSISPVSKAVSVLLN